MSIFLFKNPNLAQSLKNFAQPYGCMVAAFRNSAVSKDNEDTTSKTQYEAENKDSKDTLGNVIKKHEGEIKRYTETLYRKEI